MKPLPIVIVLLGCLLASPGRAQTTPAGQTIVSKLVRPQGTPNFSPRKRDSVQTGTLQSAVQATTPDGFPGGYCTYNVNGQTVSVFSQGRCADVQSLPGQPRNLR